MKAKQIVAVAEAVQQQQPCGRTARRLAGKTSVRLSFVDSFPPRLWLLHPSLLISI